MIDEIIDWPKPYILLSTTCDENFSCTIEIWIKKHLESDSNYNTINM